MLFPTFALGGVNTFSDPPKSFNIISTGSFTSTAPAIAYYAPMFETGLEDPHAVVGAPLSAGGYVVAGKAAECGDTCTGGNNAGMKESFASKIDATGNTVWTWTSSLPGADDAANGIVELPSGEVLVVGWLNDGGIGKRYITKLSAAGTKLWTYKGFGDSAGSNGAIELITLQGTNLLVSGLKGKPTLDEMAFKSYGNCGGGVAWMAKISISALAGSSVPTLNPATWEKEFTGYASAKATATAPVSGNIVVLLWGEDAKAAGLQMLSADGQTTIWGPFDYKAASNLEGTDIKLSADEATIGMSGHGSWLSDDLHYSGKVVLVNAVDGVTKSTTEIASEGNHALIYNECWGLVPVSDGFVVACGTGIEDCTGARASGELGTACSAGRGDPTVPNMLFGAGQWASMAAKVDMAGTLVWRRVDAYKADGETTYSAGSLSFTADSSSASEWVVKNSDGTLAFVQDETMGFGIMKTASADAGASASGGGSTVVSGKCGGNQATATGLAEASTPAGTFQFACGTGFKLKASPQTITLSGDDAAAKKAVCCDVEVTGKCGGNQATATGLAEASAPAGTFQFACGTGFSLKVNPEAIALAGADAAEKKVTCCDKDAAEAATPAPAPAKAATAPGPSQLKSSESNGMRSSLSTFLTIFGAAVVAVMMQ